MNSRLFTSQPEIRRGVWTRPAIAATSAGGAIHVRFTPPKEHNNSRAVHVGFKASYWVTNSPPENWHDKAVPGMWQLGLKGLLE